MVNVWLTFNLQKETCTCKLTSTFDFYWLLKSFTGLKTGSLFLLYAKTDSFSTTVHTLINQKSKRQWVMSQSISSNILIIFIANFFFFRAAHWEFWWAIFIFLQQQRKKNENNQFNVIDSHLWWFIRSIKLLAQLRNTAHTSTQLLDRFIRAGPRGNVSWSVTYEQH